MTKIIIIVVIFLLLTGCASSVTSQNRLQICGFHWLKGYAYIYESRNTILGISNVSCVYASEAELW